MRYLICIFVVFFKSYAFAKPPADGHKPPVGRTTGYWVAVDWVVDGDTFWAEGVKYRVAGIDAPETGTSSKHGFKCDAERRLGELAKTEAETLLLGRKIWIKPTGKWDRYGRPLVSIRYRPQKWYGEHMIRARLAARWAGKKHQWCEK